MQNLQGILNADYGINTEIETVKNQPIQMPLATIPAHEKDWSL